MKKLLSILTAVILAFALTACGSQKQNNANNSSDTPSKSDIVDESLLSIDITISASMFSEENPATDNLTQEQIDYGFKSAKINDDGSVTYTMSKKSFNNYKKELKSDTENALNALNKDYPCITSVDFNDNFSEVKISVDKSEYKKDMNFLCMLAAGFTATSYQAYTNETVLSNISVVDNLTGEVIDTATYPTK